MENEYTIKWTHHKTGKVEFPSKPIPVIKNIAEDAIKFGQNNEWSGELVLWSEYLKEKESQS